MTFLIAEVVINSFSSTLRFKFKFQYLVITQPLSFSLNQVDLQKIMEEDRKKRPHKSKFAKQFCYYMIVTILQMRLERTRISR